MKGAAVLAALAACVALPAGAAPTLAMPEHARQLGQNVVAVGSAEVAVGPWASGRIDTREAEGEVTMIAWQVPGQTDTLALLSPLRDQLRAEGFEILYQCQTEACGGFDFRYELNVLPEPDMHVDLGDFRYLAASKGADYVTLLVSRSTGTGFVQITRIGSPGPLPLAIVAGSPPLSVTGALPEERAPAPVPEAAGTMGAALETLGTVALDDLVFATGSAELGPGDFASLRVLAEYLAGHPDARVMLVGHTDAVGSLAGNIALSRLRAQSVLTRLVASYGVSAVQVDADGVGFLSPRASNLTVEGRDKNRRVEAMLASTR